jgi:SAM-dependent methyltransferase
MASRPRRTLLAFVIIAAASIGVAAGYGLRSAGKHKLISNYIRTHTVRKLQLGAGSAYKYPEFAGWLNTDLEPLENEAFLDATRPFPIPNETFHIVFSEHLVEHLTYRDGLLMMKESFRVLKPGGKIRIATPDLAVLVQLFREDKTAEMKSYIEGKLAQDDFTQPPPKTISPECVILNAELNPGGDNTGHKFVYDAKTLRESLALAGFRDIRQYSPGESDDPELRGLELRHKSVHQAINDYETMVFQAVK